MRPPLVHLYIAFFSIFLVKTGEAVTCYECSSDSLKTCATLQLKGDNELPSKICASGVTSCFSKVSNGTTIRGCNSNESGCGENGECVVCSSNKCNDEMFPESRLSCFHCEGGGCVNVKSKLDIEHPCLNYHAEDQCYSVFSPDGNVAYRGCFSDESAGKEFCVKHAEQCKKCGERGCNDADIEWGESLSCLKCASDNDENCETAVERIPSEKCTPAVFGYSNQCFVHIKDSHVQRGCLLEATDSIQTECSNSTNKSCLLCSGTDCNTVEVFPNEQCYECDSRFDSNCTENVAPYMSRGCDFSRKGCYLMRKNNFLNSKH